MEYVTSNKMLQEYGRMNKEDQKGNFYLLR